MEILAQRWHETWIQCSCHWFTIYLDWISIQRGKFGRVFRCRDKNSGLVLAAKVVTTRRKEERRNVEREIEIMKKLQHPRLIQLYDALEDLSTSEMCLVLEMWEIFPQLNYRIYLVTVWDSPCVCANWHASVSKKDESFHVVSLLLCAKILVCMRGVLFQENS